MIEFASMIPERLGGFEPTEHLTRQEFTALSSQITAEHILSRVIRGRSELVLPVDSRAKLTIDQEDRDLEEGPRPRVLAKDGFEPFISDSQPGDRFINLYNGAFSQQMKLNRRKAEEFIRIAGLEGSIVLTSVPRSRIRNIDVNPDGTVTARKSLSHGESPKEWVEEKPVRAISIPEGWRIEVCDQLIMDELLSQETRKPLDKRFVERINPEVRSILQRIVIREKLTREKDADFRLRLAETVGTTFLITSLSVNRWLFRFPLETSTIGYEIFSFIAWHLIFYAGINLLGFINRGGLRNIKILERRNIRNNNILPEMFGPPVEYDRVLRSLLYANLKGRNLVKLAKDNQGIK